MTVVAQDSCRVVLPSSAAAASHARRRLTGYLRACGVVDTAVEDAAVVVSELVTNAVRHAARGADAMVQVEWSLTVTRLRLKVSNVARATRRPLHEHEAVGGRGLSIVAALSETWSLEHADGGTTVTACLCVA